jgi:hypothetical protein
MFVSLCQELLNETKRKNSWKTIFVGFVTQHQT